MNWIQLTEADVLTVVSEAELTAWRTVASAANQADPLPLTISDVTLLVRGHCAAQVMLGPVETVLETLRAAALDLIAVRLARRVEAVIADHRLAAEKIAMELLRAVAEGTFETGANRPGGAEIVTARTRLATRENLNAL